MDKEDVRYVCVSMCVHMRTLTHTHEGVLFSQKNKEQNLATCENMNRSTGYYADWSK